VQGTTVNVSNNRLLELTKMKLLSRKEQIISGGGKQYLYYLPLMKGEDSSE
jgi:predicted transcriptional regulator